MNCILVRNIFNDKNTLGELSIPEIAFHCYTLEDKDRDLYQQTPLTDIAKTKIHGQTAIPYGTYEVAITYSNRFGKLMPQLLDVPGFAGIRIHVGNNESNTEGCILVGADRGDDVLFRSREAYNELFSALSVICKKEKVFLTIQKSSV